MTNAIRWGAVIVAALAAGCGSSPDGAGTSPTGAPPSTAAITIAAPADGARLKAKQAGRNRLRARVRLRGKARAATAVYLSAGCRPDPCHARAKTAGDGTWSVTMTLRATPGAHFVTIDANAQRDVVATGSAVATVELVGPAGVRAPLQRERESAPASSASGDDSARAPAPSRPRLPRDVIVIGDSLAIGIEQPLKALLPGWRVRVDGRIGRPLAEGMQILAREPSPPAIVAFSLFTNDDPGNTRALDAAVRATASRAPGCVVWSTIVRPPLNGVSYAAANAVLERLASDPEITLGMKLVDWAAEVAQSPSLVSPKDGVHGTPEGYRVLAQLYAAAIQECAGTR
jgi:hypothetical protein